MNMPLVSIIMPVYNGLKFLDSAIISIFNQTYKDWELLLIDDGSADGSLKRIQEWTEKDGRIKAYCHDGNKNFGVSATRNLGLKHATGKYLAFLDCDDIWYPNKLSEQVAILESDPELVLAYCKAIVIDCNGIPLSESNKIINFPHSAGNGLPGKSSIFTQLISNTVWLPCPTVIITRQVLDKIHGFAEGLTYQCEDHIFFILASHYGPVFFSDSYMAEYRIHDTSYTTNNPWQISIFETYEAVAIILPQFHSVLKNLFEKKLTEYFFLYFKNKTRRDFVICKANLFFIGFELKIVLIKTFLSVLLSRSVQITKRLKKFITKIFN